MKKSSKIFGYFEHSGSVSRASLLWFLMSAFSISFSPIFFRNFSKRRDFLKKSLKNFSSRCRAQKKRKVSSPCRHLSETFWIAFSETKNNETYQPLSKGKKECQPLPMTTSTVVKNSNVWIISKKKIQSLLET